MRFRRWTDKTDAVAALRPNRGELLEPFALFVVALIVLALAIVSLLVAQALQNQARASVAATAPATMSLMLDRARDRIAAPRGDLRQVVNDFARTAHVRSCRIVRRAGAPIDGPDGGGDEREPSEFVFTSPLAATSGETIRTLRAEIRGDDGASLGTLEVDFGTPTLPAIPIMLWTTTGMVAIVTLAAFWLIYRAFQRRVRPLGHVRDNLLAYHSGSENSLELLAVYDRSDGVSRAWNSLIGFVNDLQREVDASRCQDAVFNSAQMLQSQSSQAVLDALPIGVLRVDSKNRLVYANYTATVTLGIRDEGTCGPTLSERLGDPGLTAAIDGLRGRADGPGRDFTLERGGRQTILRLIAIDSGTSHEDELVVTVQDISQLKEAERAREDFLDHISHELRTPLTNIRAYTETLNEDFFDDEQTRRECYNVIMNETHRLTKLIEDVLSVSQIDAGATHLAREPVRVDDVLRRVVREVQASADAKSLELILRIPSKLPRVVGDPQKLHQVWTNLVGNAIKYTSAGGTVGVDVQADDKMLRVRISDTGIGIAAEFHEKIFEKFFRVNEEAVASEVGSGLGLAISREIVRMHGGTIEVESVPGEGATLIVALPLESNDAGANASRSTSSRVERGTHG
ncbi:MAG: hypothetical protein IH986_10240 [Planctomycetes bacterium]|nr:hypothetical protein [Planctomycetota bacterium]